MAKDNSTPILKIPLWSPKHKSKAKETKLTGPIRIVHSDSSVSVSNFLDTSSTVGSSKIFIISSQPSPSSSKEAIPPRHTGMENDDEAVETPLLCCRLFALLATCFEHVQDYVQEGKSWCRSKFSKKPNKASSDDDTTTDTEASEP